MTWPGVILVLSSSRVSAMRFRVSSASRSSCALEVIVAPHLLPSHVSVALEWVNGFSGHEISWFEAARPHQNKDQAKHEGAATHDQRRKVRRHPVFIEGGNARLQQNHERWHQEHGAGDDEAEAVTYPSDLLRHLGSRELSLLVNERRQLGEQVSNDRRAAPRDTSLALLAPPHPPTPGPTGRPLPRHSSKTGTRQTRR